MVEEMIRRSSIEARLRGIPDVRYCLIDSGKSIALTFVRHKTGDQS
jgi:hypothetical protein